MKTGRTFGRTNEDTVEQISDKQLSSLAWRAWERTNQERQEGAKAIIVRMLHKKFGMKPLSISMISRLDPLTFDELVTLGEALFDFATPDDLDQWLHWREAFRRLVVNGRFSREKFYCGFSEAGTPLIPAYFTLLEKGYSVRQTGKGYQMRWLATKDDRQFRAEDPLSLLGLVAVYEARGETGRADDEQIESFLKQYYPET